MPIYNLIACIDRNRAIGLNGDQLVYIKEDLKRFKELTMGHTIVMGRRTNEVIPNRRLPGRRNVVISKSLAENGELRGVEGVEVLTGIPEMVEALKDESEVFIIGGEMLYRSTMHLASRLHLTLIDAAFPEADAFFPSFDDWREVWSSDCRTDPKYGLSYRYVTMERKVSR